LNATVASAPPILRFQPDRRVMRMLAMAAAVVTAVTSLAAAAAADRTLDVRFQPVAPNVFAYIGDIGPRSVANEGLNANIGLVVTDAGAVLIDSGSTARVAAAIEEGVRRVTAQPVRWVINTGGQDHRWLGNAHFKARGAELIAHAAAVSDMRSRGGEQIAALGRLLGERAGGTVAELPVRLIDQSRTKVALGGTQFEFMHSGGGHTPGDMMIWLPDSRILFAGDIVYVDRLPAILPVSNSRDWLKAFDVIELLAPRRIVPGHGDIAGEERARRHTRDYLAALRAHMKRAVDDGVDLDAAVRSFDPAAFRHLANATELAAANANRVYLEVERE
jgi:glyoxylase-like metal-dependent hydrolase (beta-lactamase superfamily II)